MALTDEKKQNGIYLSIVNGKISQKVTPETEGAIARMNSKDKEVFEKRFGGVSGFLLNLYVEDKEDFGNQLIIKLVDKGEFYTLQMGLGTSYAQNFLNRFSNPIFRFNKPVNLSSYRIAREDNAEKFNEGITITQEDVKIPVFYTKENPGSLPRGVEKKEGKKTKWDFTDVNNFWIEKVAFWNVDLKARKNEILLLANPE